MDLDDFDFINNDITCTKSLNDQEKDIFDFPLLHSTPSINRLKQNRAIDFPSTKKHYGLVTFCDYQMPIIYRLMHDNFYIPYIRFSYVLNIFEHSLYNNYYFDIRNLPIIEMTPTEKCYYDELSSTSNFSDWSHYQLLSISVLDAVLSIVNLMKILQCQNNSQSIDICNEWQETLNKIRHEARERWILDEKIVLTRLREKDDMNSSCISSTNMAQRRSSFEQRLDLSITDEAGGFVQIDSYIYAFVKNRSNNKIYLNLHDIRQNFILPSSCKIFYCNKNSLMYHNYNVVLEQAQLNYEWNVIRRGRNHDLSKVLLSVKGVQENLFESIPFVPLETLLSFLSDSNSKPNLKFIQLFETASLNDIDLNYKNNVGRQFIMGMKRQGGLINKNIPYFISSQSDLQVIWIPTETKTKRIITNDERIYLNMILLHHGLWQNILTKNKQWFLQELNHDDKENINTQMFLASK